jgi:predicted nucleic acid-binding protein
VIVLDTNVLGELTRPNPASAVFEWVNVQPASELVTTSVTLAESLYGVARLPDGRRKAELARVASAIFDRFRGRIWSFDASAAQEYADLVAARFRLGRPISVQDAQIAAICRSRGAVLATRNVKDFEGVGVAVVNPWTADLDTDDG